MEIFRNNTDVGSLITRMELHLREKRSDISVQLVTERLVLAQELNEQN